METGVFVFGAVISLIGIALLFIQNIAATIWGVILIILGISLIIFRKEESKIEQRKDIKTKKIK